MIQSESNPIRILKTIPIRSNPNKSEGVSEGIKHV